MVTERYQVGRAGLALAKGRLDGYATLADRAANRSAYIKTPATCAALPAAQMRSKALREFRDQRVAFFDLIRRQLIKANGLQRPPLSEAVRSVVLPPMECFLALLLNGWSAGCFTVAGRWFLPDPPPVVRPAATAALVVLAGALSFASVAFSSRRCEEAVKERVETRSIRLILYQRCSESFAKCARGDTDDANRVHGVERFGHGDQDSGLAQGVDESE